MQYKGLIKLKVLKNKFYIDMQLDSYRKTTPKVYEVLHLSFVNNNNKINGSCMTRCTIKLEEKEKN